jgi:DNA invertase Pin-like site-specific DNA recombinase
MGRTLAYLRTSTDKQDLNNQKLAILEHARRQGCRSMTSSPSPSRHASSRERKLDELLAQLAAATRWS